MRADPPLGNALDPQLIALQALGWVLQDEQRAQRLLDLTGLDPSSLRERAGDATMLAALARQKDHADPALHRDWIAPLVRDYYDPMYAYQQRQRAGRIVFQGDRQAVLDYLRASASTAGTAGAAAAAGGRAV